MSLRLTLGITRSSSGLKNRIGEKLLCFCCHVMQVLVPPCFFLSISPQAQLKSREKPEVTFRPRFLERKPWRHHFESPGGGTIYLQTGYIFLSTLSVKLWSEAASTTTYSMEDWRFLRTLTRYDTYVVCIRASKKRGVDDLTRFSFPTPLAN